MHVGSQMKKRLALTAEQAVWFHSQTENDANVNPMCRKHGIQEGEICKDCKFIVYTECSKRYYKCKLRGITSGPGTDHRLKWPACRMFISKSIFAAEQPANKFGASAVPSST